MGRVGIINKCRHTLNHSLTGRPGYYVPVLVMRLTVTPDYECIGADGEDGGKGLQVHPPG